MTDEEKAAAEEKAKTEAASAAAAELAKRKAETAARADNDAPVRMVDLHDLRAELVGELAAARRAEHVPHAVPPAARAPAQPRSGGVLAGVVGGVTVFLVLLGLAVVAERRK